MQKVNLYNGALLPKPEVLPLYTLWSTAAAAIVISLGLWFMQWSEVNKTQQKLDQLLNQKGQMQRQLTELQSIVLTVEEKILAERKIKMMQLQLERQQKTSELIAELNKKQSAGYFGVMKDLADLDKKQLWLTRIRLDSDRLSLEGKTMESAMVANMVNQLQKLPNTKKVMFKKVVIEREALKKRAVKFYLYADSDGADNEDK